VNAAEDGCWFTQTYTALNESQLTQWIRATLCFTPIAMHTKV